MSKRTYAVEPQRSTGLGWVMCSPVEAERFALVELTIWHAKSDKGFRRQFRKRRVLDTFGTQAEANTELASKLRRK